MLDSADVVFFGNYLAGLAGVALVGMEVVVYLLVVQLHRIKHYKILGENRLIYNNFVLILPLQTFDLEVDHILDVAQILHLLHMIHHNRLWQHRGLILLEYLLEFHILGNIGKVHSLWSVSNS